MYCFYCKKEVDAVGEICPYCANKFTQEQIINEKTAKEQAEASTTVTKSKMTAIILNIAFCGIGGMAYLGFKQIARQRLKEWLLVFLYSLTVIGVIFAIPKMIKLIALPFIDMKNIFSTTDMLENDKGEIIIWK